MGETIYFAPMDYAVIQACLLPLSVAGIAFLYSSVGHGGATGYLAIAALVGLAPTMARPGALWMNCAVAGIAFWRFRQAGCFDAKVFWQLAVASVPCAWIGSQLHLDGRIHALVLAAALIAAGVMLAWKKTAQLQPEQRPPAWPFALVTGAALGTLAGLTGIGGGVFLTPLLILLNWTPSKVAAGISALFIVVNSIAGLLGLGASALVWQPIYAWAVALGILGALLGTQVSLKRWHPISFHRALAAVLWIAAGKLALTGK